jgi:hypothetical protein
MIEVLTIQEIEKRIQSMNLDRKRGFSMEEFSRFACIDYRNLKKMCLEGSIPITELSQRKLSKALLALEKGEAGLRMDIAGRKYLDFHPSSEYKIPMKRGISIEKTNDGFSLSVKPVNKMSYSTEHLLKKKRG